MEKINIESQSPKSGQFNSDFLSLRNKKKEVKKSQSPKSGQFNSDEVKNKKLLIS